MAKAQDEFRGLLVFCSGRVQDAIPQFSSLSDLNPNVTGLFAEIILERDHYQNFGETTSCVTISFLIKFKCHCFNMFSNGSYY